MAPKPKQPKTTREEDSLHDFSQSSPIIPESRNIHDHRRSGLSVYTSNPETFPKSIVVRHTADFVVINDLYPKSSIHLLVLPRNQQKTLLHPFAAFDGSDTDFLESVKAECRVAKQLAASELRRRFGKQSLLDRAREDALSSQIEPDSDSELPTGRDWAASIMVGVHAVPSMSNLHIHVISVDRFSERLKHRKHYNSFATSFFVPLSDLPLAADDPRRQPGREGYLKMDFKCWRCGREFGSRFAQLKLHLEEEFEEWKRE